MSDCCVCERLKSLLRRDRMAERITIWHESSAKPDRVLIGIAADDMEPLTGQGETIDEALTDLERRVVENHGV